MRITAAAFITSASKTEECPRWNHPEFSFLGRSNVGKSSLINLLAGRHSLARVSATPGKTRLANFFLMNNQWSLVDLPGYGYAKGPKAETHHFERLVCSCLERVNLRHSFVLIDSRHSPQRADLSFLSWLSSTPVPFSLIFTKTDQQPRARIGAGIDLFLEAISSFLPFRPEVFACSSKTRAGREEILGAIARHLGPQLD